MSEDYYLGTLHFPRNIGLKLIVRVEIFWKTHIVEYSHLFPRKWSCILLYWWLPLKAVYAQFGITVRFPAIVHFELVRPSDLCCLIGRIDPELQTVYY